MPVDTPHKEYAYYAPLWQTAYDVTDGEYVVKARGTQYLPRLGGQDALDYADYLLNARFYNASARTIQGYLGAAFRVPPVVTVPTMMEDWLPDVTLAGLSLDGLLKKDVEEKFKTGRFGFRVDYSEAERRPFLAYYGAQHIVNWREEVIGGHRVLVQVVLRESEMLAGEDEFMWEEKEVYHVLDLDGQGVCRARKFRQLGNTETWSVELMDPPTRRNVPLPFVPFIFDGVSDITPSCEKPPLLDLFSVNLGHYRVTADYYDAIRFSSKPQGWINGMQKPEEEVRIGSRNIWFLPPPEATANFLEYTGAGIGNIRQALIDDESRMARLGAAVIEEPKLGVESAETSRINQSGKTSLLSSLTTTTGQAMTNALRMAAWWAGLTESLDDQDIGVVMNQDFIEARLSPQDLLALVQSWQARGISRETLTYNVKRGGLLPKNVTASDEMALIDAEAPLPNTEADNLDAQEEPPQKEAA